MARLHEIQNIASAARLLSNPYGTTGINREVEPCRIPYRDIPAAEQACFYGTF